MRFGAQTKKKAITFSSDDGVTQDIRRIELLNKYGLTCTFNLNSGLLSKNEPGAVSLRDTFVQADKKTVIANQ